MSSCAPSDHVCYVHCNFCNTILVVSVPRADLSSIVTVRCGHCANLLSVNMGALPQQAPLLHEAQKFQEHSLADEGLHLEYESSSTCNRISLFNAMGNKQQEITPAHMPEKQRQRVPSAYNRFIKDEIRRLKATNPHISHREAFSAAAKNWAHFPHIHFGRNFELNKQVKNEDPTIAAPRVQDYQRFY